ncbi:MAG TPA: 16S rRNA (guanine(527)-N(7))-methyltransferase RsmG [Tepidisphaeraceae bacterium]|jgi:16S rRNA (guanine527-N7)-methyltransferase
MNPIWTEIAAKAGVTLSPEQLEKIDQYLALLIEKSKVLNLTRITDLADAEIKHVADALTLLEHIPQDTRNIGDVGTGGGIPGVILAIARPDLTVTLIDSTRKKIDAVTEMCAAIGLTNVRMKNERMESLNEKYDVVTARGVVNLNQLLIWCRPLMKRKTILLALKGPRIEDEIAELNPQNRRQWKIALHDVEIEGLQGHRICEAQIKKD